MARPESPIEGIVNIDTFRIYVVGYVQGMITRIRKDVRSSDPLIDQKETLLDTTLAITPEEVLEGGLSGLGRLPQVTDPTIPIALEELLALGEGATTYEEKMRRRSRIAESVPHEAAELVVFLHNKVSSAPSRRNLFLIHNCSWEEDVPDSIKNVLNRQYEATQQPVWKYVDVQIGRASLTFQLKSEFVVGDRDEVSKVDTGGAHLNLSDGNWRNVKSSAVELDKLGDLIRSGVDVDDPRVQEQIERLSESFDLDVTPASLQEMRDIVALLEKYKDRVKPNLR